jgi:hypothetical protein
MTDTQELTWLRIEVRPSAETNDHEVRLLASDDEDLIHRFDDSMMGMDPDQILVEPSPLGATDAPREVTIGRCGCGVVGCGSIEVRIEREGDRVTWRALASGVSLAFDADAYDAEIQRALADRSWETPDRTAARLIREGVDRAQLARHGFAFTWASGRIGEAEMTIALTLEPGPYQVLVHVPWDEESPEAIAAACVRVLSENPASWRASWYPQATGLSAPPIAGPRWRKE